ncbi:hypothetical protein J7T55_012689 [Diaporthe amygdali]|uniref:uncharacterized protein n=1 Tax=Phomopsis amygdali TaxID=1214568 RepID=UPI0022FECE43|nr:uncharacterized protein J7T55_012689 [Diaporthe amygdali]KAJ0115410.1 hypothetical protein J7T55_012689 [Diaporthe amygdali]
MVARPNLSAAKFEQPTGLLALRRFLEETLQLPGNAVGGGNRCPSAATDQGSSATTGPGPTENQLYLGFGTRKEL